ncbi:hypothetical protein Pmani_024265 [Petrolisthes manimaculis]|uniref:HTH CENPB-type domain-containing protein n=1 Tax=Petrolisthes manimaculis TaxID=1843537 RepID=A0AAE1P869_9EUCA|nr:hypothetical protein Pmani_024265 [Petrolisthes manimaculis]
MPKRPANSVLSGPSPKVQRKGITIEEKIKVLVALSKGNGASSVGRQFGLSESSVRTIKKNEEKIRAAYASPDISKNKLHLKSAVYTEMENALTLWMEDMRRRKLTISGPMVQEQAYTIQSQIVAKQGKSTEEMKFTASTGWLYKFMKRIGTKNITVTGEAASADYGAAEEMKIKMKEMVEEINYSPQQVWNCDETGLYWKRMPKRTYIMKNEEKAPGLKVSKQRLTVLLMANAAGTERLKPLVIHHSARPRAFKNVFISKLPVLWRANKKAWMTSSIFDEWYIEHAIPAIENVNKKHNMANRAMVITDNASSHSKHLCTVSDDVKLCFLPPNVTSLIQPLDQGVIALFKRYYLRFTMQQMANAMDRDKDLTAPAFWKSYTIKDAIANISRAWNSVPESALNGVWRNIWPDIVNDFKGFDAASDVKAIVKLGKEIRGDEGFQELQENDVVELLHSMDEPLTAEAALEIAEMAKENDDDEESTENSAQAKKEMTIPKLKNFMQNINAAIECAIQDDHDMERSMQVGDALRRAASTYSNLLEKMVTAQQQRTITSFFRPLTPPGECKCSCEE